ncbi:hypothetical protein [Zhihengliuella halotolerans]|uniref:Uncharacterized protein n=1 Tax=Zhihengliuella halotolerans TaxID=370736 RepID=A0A4V2G9U7_9MICC|nr:hypothetical protein [Zhihengliuella halotolerans]RZU61756.1 hypothetical protein EV380_1334 [Zhihengliuella halotolerans]
MNSEPVDYPEMCGIHAEGDVWVAAADRSNLCTPCREQLADSLRAIDEAWPRVLDALQRGRSGGGSERMGSTEVHAPLPINAGASDAMRLAREAVWSAVHQLVMDRPGARVPEDQSTPALAGWLARWHVEYLAGHPNGSWTVEWYTEIQRAADAVEAAAVDGVVEVETQMQCGHRESVGSTGAERGAVRCTGVVTVVDRPGVGQVAVCSRDPQHAVPADAWFKAMRSARPQRRGARPRGLAGSPGRP